MNLNKTTLVVLALLLGSAFYYQFNQARETQVAVTALTKDRDSLKRQVNTLNQFVAEAKEREANPPPAAETPAPRVAAPPPKPVVRVEEPPPPGVTRKAPAGWGKNGSKTDAYYVGVDQNQSFGGQPAAYVQSIDPTVDGFGGMMQTISPEDYLGKRVRLSGWMKTEDANDGGGHLWLRVDGQQVGQSLQFDNMNNRAPKGTTDWQQYSVVLDVPPESTALAYGFFVQGGGKVWVSGTKLEPVGAEVPSTNMNINRPRSLPKAPVNLSFDPNHGK